MKWWLKGGLIGLVFALLLLVVSVFFNPLGFKMPQTNAGFLMTILMLSVLMAIPTAIGAFIGSWIDFIIKKSKEKTPQHQSF